MRHFLRTTMATFVLSALLVQSSMSAAEPDAVSLFNGKDLSGWTPYIWDRYAGKQDTKIPVDTVWTVVDGVLICDGRPTGYLRTKTEHANYLLTFEWRFPPGSSGGNSGILVHTTTPNALGQWPKSVEVQLFRRNAGDFWVIPFDTTLKVKNEAARRRGRRYLNLTDDSEKPIGDWNKMEITCRGDEIIVKVNGDLVNHATDCSVQKGAICLQSEGAEIHFRKIVLTPLRR